MKEWVKQTGFTIVELAIVISVIGIIATIAVVSYNSSLVTGRNAKTAAAAEQYKEGLENYLTLKKAYPAVSQWSSYCLNIAVTSCVAGPAVPNWTRSTALEDFLKTVMDTLPTPSGGPGTNSTYDPAIGYIPYRGVGNSPTLDGVNSGFLVYVLEGATTCPVGPVASRTSWPAFFSATPAAGRTYMDNNMTVCWVPLSRP